MIRIVPAMDIIDGKCVRLTQGDFGRKTSYETSPLEMAKELEDYGFKYLHLVGLDNAKIGRINDTTILEKLCANTKLHIDYGGGINSSADIEKILNAGASQVNCGSWAVREPEQFAFAIEQYSDQIILSADALEGKIAINGWQKDSGIELGDFIEEKQQSGIRFVTSTDIDKDGAMKGPATHMYKKLRRQFPDLFLTASGGIRNIADVLEMEKEGMDAVIIGKAIYEGAIRLEDLSKLIDHA